MLVKGIKFLPKKKKTKNENMAVNDIRISQRMKNKGYMSIEKYIKRFE